MHRCLVCGKTITWRFAICTDCEQIYGSKATGWPEWLRFMWADEQRERRRARQSQVFEVPLDDYLEQETVGLPNGRKQRRHRNEY